MKKIWLITLIFTGLLTYAQESSLEVTGLQQVDASLFANIATKIIYKNEILWQFDANKTTKSGVAIPIQLKGTNLVIQAQIMPIVQTDGSVMVIAQGMIVVADQESESKKMHTTVRAIPARFGEKVYFFPLGSPEEMQDSPVIQIEIVVTLLENIEFIEPVVASTHVDEPDGVDAAAGITDAAAALSDVEIPLVDDKKE